MGDILTLSELQDAAPGATLTERRYSPVPIITGGRATLEQLWAEHRSASGVAERRTAAQLEFDLSVLECEADGLPWWEARTRALERQIREQEQRYAYLYG
jgi:hypothetical protein